MKSLLRRCHLSVLLLALAPALGPVWAAADRPADGDDESSETDTGGLVEYVEVSDSSQPASNTIATKLSVPLQRTPAIVGTVGPALLYEQKDEYLGDALENVSGLNVQNGSGVSEYFAIRGFDSISSGLVLTDGAPEPEVSYYQTYNVRGVEVFKGPAGFLYGKNALAGVVNVVRKQPVAGDFATFQGSAGSFGLQEGTLDWNRASSVGAVGFRLNGLWQEADHYRDDKQSRHRAVNPTLRARVGRSGTLNVSFEYVDAEYSPDSGLPLVDNRIPDVPRRRSYQSSRDFSEQTLDKVQVDYETRLNDTVTLRNKAYYRDLDWQSDGTLLLGQADLGGGEHLILRDLALLDDKQEFLGNQFEAVISVEGARVEHALLAGVELERETDEYTFDFESLPETLLSDPSVEIPDAFPFPLNSAGDVTNDVVAPYVIDQMKLSRQVELTLGARYDDIRVDGDVAALAPPGFGSTVSFSRDDSELSPMAGIVVAPDPQLSLYAHASRSFAPPSTRLAQEQDPESRRPERGTQYELGVKRNFLDGRVRTSLALYQLERDRIAITGADGFTQHSGDQRSRGLEIEVAAEMRPRLRWLFSYAYNDAELTDFEPCLPDGLGGCQVMHFTGNTPKMAPKNLAHLWLSKSFDHGLGVAGGARWVDRQFIYEDNAFELDGSLVLDAALMFDMEPWRFKLNFKNLTDEEYETIGVAGATSVIPADPFAVYASVEFRLR